MKKQNWLAALMVVLMMVPALDVDAQIFRKKKPEASKTETSAAPRPSAYQNLFRDKKVVTASSDFITLHKVDEKQLLFQIPVSLLDREMLLASTLSEISSPGYGDIGYKAKPPLHIRFSRRNNSINLCQISSVAETDDFQTAMNRTYGDVILFSYPIMAYTPDSLSVVIDVTPLFTTPYKPLEFLPDDQSSGTRRMTSQFKKDASSLDDIKSFEDNLSVKSIMTYGITVQMSGRKVVDDQPLTAKVTRSLLLLPEEKMQPRISDSRVGIFNTRKVLFSERQDGTKNYSVANRFRLIPSDVAAYGRGELVEPVQPIVFYVDDTFPEQWKEPIRQGVETWNMAFEKTGFKNAIIARDFPADDPEFDPDNLKYNCIRFLPSTTANAMGPSWVDPATGEIINASVLVYSDIIKLINNWRFVQTAQVDERVRAKKMPEDVVFESLRYVMAHEVGHCLGFMHNMAASAAYPVEKLRDPEFTRANGTTPSIMDYARFNYVAQPGDKGVRLSPPDLGVYDYFLIEWNYRYLPGFDSEWAEKPTVESWADRHAGDPLYRYGRQQMGSRYDPSSIEEDLGDDPMVAGRYGIDNLKYILPNLNRWVTEDSDFQHRQTLYGQIANQYYRYIRNVMYNVGGIYLTEVKEGTPGEKHASVPREIQKKSLQWVMDELRNMEWIDNPEIKRNLPMQVDPSYTLRTQLVRSIPGLINNVVLSAHYSDSPYSVEEFMNDLYQATWRNEIRGRSLAREDMILQKAMVAMMCEPLAEQRPGGNSSGIAFAPTVYEIMAYGLDESGFVESYYGLLYEYEQLHGPGSVSQLLEVPDYRFGPAGMGFQGQVNVSAINTSTDYLKDMAVRSRTLLRNRVASTSGSTKAHYQSLLMQINNVLADKL